jgi:hypothetical protein
MQLAINAGLSTAKGRKYVEAAAEYRRRGVCAKDARLSMFIKEENYPFEEVFSSNSMVHFFFENSWFEIKRENRIPRPIQHRRPVWFIAASQYFLPLEHEILPMTAEQLGFGPSELRVFGKGLSIFSKAELLAEKFSRFQDPVAFCADGSKWDRQVNEFLLVVELLFYLPFIHPDDHQEFIWLFMHQVYNKGFYYGKACTIRYSTVGGRCSGDLNTGLGNCVIFFIILASCLIDPKTNRPRFSVEFAIDGDDAIIICERSCFEELVTYIKEGFRLHGHTLTVEGVADDLRNVVWCQGRPVRVGLDNRWVLMRDPRVVIGKALTSDKYVGSKPLDHLYVIALGELVLARGCPVVQSWCVSTMEYCRSKGATLRPYFSNQEGLYRRLRDYLVEIGMETELFRLKHHDFPNSAIDMAALHAKMLTVFRPLDVTRQSRDDYEVAFGISSSAQIQLEEQFTTLRYFEGTISIGSAYDIPHFSSVY